MKANKIEQNKVYEITVGKNTTVVRVVEIERRVNGSLVFQCENVKTGKPMSVADADRFRKEIKAEKKISNPIGNAAKRIIDAMGFGPGSVKAEEEANASQNETKKKKSLREVIESKGITLIPKGRRATSTMRDLDDPTFTRKHHVDENGVLVLEAEDDETDNETKKERGKGGRKNGMLSGLDAAHKVLLEAGRPMNAKEITETATTNGYCDLRGATPSATISAAMQREISAKQDESRFVKAGKGLFAAR